MQPIVHASVVWNPQHTGERWMLTKNESKTVAGVVRLPDRAVARWHFGDIREGRDGC
jgi:hypothetical protein